MLRFGKTKIGKEKFHDVKKLINIWELDANNIVISNLIETNNNSKYLIEYLDEITKPLVSILSKMSEYVKTYKDKDENKTNKLMHLRIDGEKLLKKYKTIWTKIEDLKNIKLNALPGYKRNIETKIRMYGDKVYTNFCSSNVPEYGVECVSFTIISIDSLLVYESKYYLQAYLNNCAYKIVNKEMVDYLDDNLFESD